MSSDNASSKQVAPYFQDRELSWLEFNKRVLDQGMDPSVPLFERLNFLSIFWSNLQEFFMIRVGSLTDLSLLKTPIIDNKTGLTATEQLSAIYKRCHELYPEYDKCYKQIRKELSQKGVLNKRDKNLDAEQREYIEAFFDNNIMPFLSPQIVNSRHPFPHLENGALYVVVRLDEGAAKGTKKKDDDKAKDKKSKNVGAEGVTLGIIPLPGQCSRITRLPGQGLQFMLLEHVIEMFVDKVFSMYKVKHTNVICITRNADLDASEGAEEQGDDFREHIKRILKKRTRLMPVRLESERELSSTVKEVLLDKLNLHPHQTFATPVPLDLSYVYDLPSMVDDETRRALSLTPFTPEWPVSLDRRKPLIPQIEEKDVLLSYPYESMDAFVQLLKEAAFDPNVTSIKITLYRISKQSSIAEALVAAAENGKEVTALFELRARFDESNNIDYSQRLEEAGCHVLYGFRDYKVHSKICCITRRVSNGVEYITQVGTGNYNEKTAKLYTDFSFMTTDHKIGRDAAAFFRNMTLESLSDEYNTLWVAPLQIKQNILRGIDEQIARKKKGLPNGLFFKTNSITDKDVIDKIVEASQAGVKCTLLVRGISCIVPGIKGYTDNVCVVSIVGRLLEHSRIYLFGAFDDDFDVYLSSADLMTRNMDKRIEVAWPVKDPELRKLLLGYIGTCMADTAKLRDLLPNKKYTELGYFAKENRSNGEVVLFDSQNYLINQAQQGKLLSDEFVASTVMPNENLVREDAETELELTELMVDHQRVDSIENEERTFEDRYIPQDDQQQEAPKEKPSKKKRKVVKVVKGKKTAHKEPKTKKAVVKKASKAEKSTKDEKQSKAKQDTQVKVAETQPQMQPEQGQPFALGLENFKINPSGGSFSLHPSVLEQETPRIVEETPQQPVEPADSGSKISVDGQYIYLEPMDNASVADAQAQRQRMASDVDDHGYEQDAVQDYSDEAAQSASDLNNPRRRTMLQKQWQQWIQENPELYQQFLLQRSMQYQQLRQQQAEQQGMDMDQYYEDDQVMEADFVPDEENTGKKKSWLRRLLSGE